MKDELKVLNRLLGKITALRATLSDDERVILDRLFSRSYSIGDEVEGHAFKEKVVDKNVAKSVSAMDDEVEGHAFKEKVVDKNVAKSVSAMDDEVEGHAMTSKIQGRSISVRIAYDAEKGSYIAKAEDEAATM